MEKESDIRQQVEYYLSDKNLEKDQLFYEKILEDKEGYIDIDMIMKCNKIKNMNISKETLVASIKNSTEVEADAKGDKIRRKGNKSLPEAKFKNKKLKVAEKVTTGSKDPS